MKKFLLSFAFLLGLTASAAAQQTVFRVNCGGPAYIDSKGQTWQADFGFIGGKAEKTRPRSRARPTRESSRPCGGIRRTTASACCRALTPSTCYSPK